jgi:DNA-directed RNA polymerase sigma subunit (sigma70/sigma32)
MSIVDFDFLKDKIVDLSPIHQCVLSKRYGISPETMPISLSDVANELSLDPREVRQLENEALKYLYELNPGLEETLRLSSSYLIS